jgi:hypothetical protein
MLIKPFPIFNDGQGPVIIRGNSVHPRKDPEIYAWTEFSAIVHGCSSIPFADAIPLAGSWQAVSDRAPAFHAGQTQGRPSGAGEQPAPDFGDRLSGG